MDLSALYAVSQNLADVLNLSYGACEDDFGDSDTTFYTNIWAQAAAQGMTALVASGDSGAAGCEGQPRPTGTIRSVNGLGSSPYATCVGGTQYLDTANPVGVLERLNDPVTKKSAKGPIPEGAWNESGGGASLAATGGGPQRSLRAAALAGRGGNPAGNRPRRPGHLRGGSAATRPTSS